PCIESADRASRIEDRAFDPGLREFSILHPRSSILDFPGGSKRLQCRTELPVAGPARVARKAYPGTSRHGQPEPRQGVETPEPPPRSKAASTASATRLRGERGPSALWWRTTMRSTITSTRCLRR